MEEKIDYFKYHIHILKLGGCWLPAKGTPNRFLYIVYDIICFAFSTVFSTCSQLIIMTSTFKNLDEFMQNANVAVMYLLSAIKYMHFHLCRTPLIEIMDKITENVSDFDGYKDYSPSNIKRRTINRMVNIAKLYLYAVYFEFLILMSVLMYIWYFHADKHCILSIDSNNQTKWIYTQKLLTYGWIPWDYTRSRQSYLLAILIQALPLLTAVWSMIGYDNVFTAIMSYMSCQLDIIQNHFRTVRPRTYKRLGLKYRPVLKETTFVNKELNKDLNKGIKALQVIFQLCDKMESLYTYLTLIQVLISLAVMCTCLFLVSSANIKSEIFISQSIYLIAICIQLGQYCFFGSQVTVQADDISLSLYLGDWFSADKSFKSSMLVTMARMQKPLYVTIGKFTPLTLTTFVTIARASYSFLAVIKSVNE